MGRNKLPVIKDKAIRVRLEPELYDSVIKKTEEDGINVSQFMRDLILTALGDDEEDTDTSRGG